MKIKNFDTYAKKRLSKKTIERIDKEAEREVQLIKNKKKLSHKAFKKEAMKDPVVAAAYEALRPEFEVIEKCIKVKKRH